MGGARGPLLLSMNDRRKPRTGGAAVWAACGILALGSAAAGSLTVTDRDQGIAVRVVSPDNAMPPATDPGWCQVAPSTEIRAVRPTPLYLKGAGDLTFGPFPWQEGAEVRIGSRSYRIAGIDENSFSLTEPRSGFRHGPFAATNGAAVGLPGTNVTFRRPPSFVGGDLSHRRLSVTTVAVALVPLTPANRQAVARLAATFLALQRQYELDVSPTQYVMPRIHDMFGRDRLPISTPSEADVARARRQADGGAKAAFRRFLAATQAEVADCRGGRRFVFRNVAPGAYAVCAAADVRPDTDTRGVQPGLVIWWAGAEIRPFQATDLRFDEDNARDWQTLFQGDDDIK